MADQACDATNADELERRLQEAAQSAFQEESKARADARRLGCRKEALRAASRIVAGVYSSSEGSILDKEGQPDSTQGATLFLAEQFAKWLGTGER